MTTIEHAERMLKAWQDAEYSSSIGNKSYTINGRNILRYSLTEIREQVNYWTIQVNKLNQGMNSTSRVGRCIPWGR